MSDIRSMGPYKILNDLYSYDSTEWIHRLLQIVILWKVHQNVQMYTETITPLVYLDFQKLESNTD